MRKQQFQNISQPRRRRQLPVGSISAGLVGQAVTVAQLTLPRTWTGRGVDMGVETLFASRHRRVPL